MDLDSFKCFLAVVNHSSFTRAARSLHLSQPAVSRRVRSLELWAGTDLLIRDSFPIRLTAAGEELTSRLLPLMAEISDLRAILRSRVTLPGQTATVAISHSIADRFFPMWLRSAYGTDIFPPIRIIAMDTNSSIESLLVGDCELVVLYTDSEHDRGFVPEDITFVTLREETIRLLAAPAFGSKLGAEPEQGMAIISHGGGYFMGQTSDSIMSEMPNGRFRAVIECGLTSCVLTLALQGFGAAWLPMTLAEPYLLRRELVVVGDPDWYRTIRISMACRTTGLIQEGAAQLWTRAQQMSVDGSSHLRGEFGDHY